MAEKKSLYEKYHLDYKNIFESYTETEKMIAEAIFNLDVDAHFGDNTKEIIDISTGYNTGENNYVEIISKIIPLLFFERSKNNDDSCDKPFITKLQLIIEILLKENLFNPNYQFSNGGTFLHILNSIITEEKDLNLLFAITSLAIENGFNVNTKDKNGNTILHLAITNPVFAIEKNRHYPIEAYLKLLCKKFDFNISNNENLSITNLIDDYPEQDCRYYWLTTYYKGFRIGFPILNDTPFKLFLKDLIPESKDKACFIDDKNLITVIIKLNFSVNRLIRFLNFNNPNYRLYETNEYDNKENLRNQIDKRQEEYNSLKEDTLSILKECFPGYENDVLEFITSDTITPAMSIIYSTLLTSHSAVLNKTYLNMPLMLPFTPDKTFYTFVELFKLEYGCNKVIGDIISRKLEVTSKRS